MFFQQFVKSLLKIKLEELFNKGTYSTAHFTEQEADDYVAEYWIDAVFDKKQKSYDYSLLTMNTKV
ncbi:hypothetical protein FACS189429_1890 [Bacteroidia bacterium]|nr:hypothetical protein FACS189429_1890 [Bacteroidia bacterium]